MKEEDKEMGSRRAIRAKRAGISDSRMMRKPGAGLRLFDEPDRRNVLYDHSANDTLIQQPRE
jgi:hypothetical protein